MKEFMPSITPVQIPKPPATPRPPSAREHHALVQQVRSSLAEASERAPAGVNPQEIRQRRRLLENVLSDLEKEGYRDNSLRQKHVDDNRSESERIEAERIAKSIEDSNMRQVTHFISHTLMRKDLADVKAMQSKSREEKTFQCKVQNEELRRDQFESLQAHEDNRQRRLALLEERRLNTLQQKQQRCKYLAAQAEKKRMQMLESEENQYLEKLNRANELRQERELKSESARQRKEALVLEKQSVATRRKVFGPGTKTSVFFSGKGAAPILCTTVRDHEDRLRKLEKDEHRAKELYSADQELRDFLKDALKQRAETRVKKAENSYDHILDEKLEAHERLRSSEKLKEAFINERKKIQQARIRSQSAKKASSIQFHQQAAADETYRKSEKVAQDNLFRWNQRSATVVEDILDKYGKLQSAKMLQHEYVSQDDDEELTVEL